MLYTYINISSLSFCINSENRADFMPNPATHCLINLALFFPFREKLGRYWSIFAIFSGLLPDFDFVIGWILKWLGYNNSFFGHGGFFHSLGFVLVLFGISAIIYWKYKEYGKYGFILTIGVALHILVDYLLGGGAYSLMLFYPISTETFRLHILENLKFIDIYEILDAILIIFALIFMTLKIKCLAKKTRKS